VPFPHVRQGGLPRHLKLFPRIGRSNAGKPLGVRVSLMAKVGVPFAGRTGEINATCSWQGDILEIKGDFDEFAVQADLGHQLHRIIQRLAEFKRLLNRAAIE